LRVAVIGAGIQGTCVAMELADRGVSVDLFESNPSLMDEASRQNEGKIHLGFVYANDPSLRTAELMYRGARQFAPLMRRWLGTEFDQIPVSTSFNYAVHRDSLLSADQLHDVYRRISSRMGEEPTGSYFGIEDPGTVIKLEDSDHDYGPAVDTVFHTREVAVNPGPVADLITKRVLDNDGIQILTGATVTAVDPGLRLIHVSTSGGAPGSRGPYDHIVNCTWGGRPAIDATAGLVLDRTWTFRMKYFLLATPRFDQRSLPSTTVVLGGFGDVVDYGDGDFYLSWYPSGRLGWSTDLTPPRWPSRPDPVEATEIARKTLENLELVVPGISEAITRSPTAVEVRGGVIYSLGNSDVDDPASEFHKRSEVGLRSLGAYHSVDTGKYTTAPLFAVETADRVTST
jgi:glycine/D-amino acid oxidase-like deaminating enzyme